MSDFVVSQGALKLWCFSAQPGRCVAAVGALCHMVICLVKMLSLEAQPEDPESGSTVCIRQADT